MPVKVGGHVLDGAVLGGQGTRSLEAQIADGRSGVRNGCEPVPVKARQEEPCRRGTERAPFQLWTVPLFCTVPFHLPYLPRSTTGAPSTSCLAEEAGAAQAPEARTHVAKRAASDDVGRCMAADGRNCWDESEAKATAAAGTLSEPPTSESAEGAAAEN